MPKIRGVPESLALLAAMAVPAAGDEFCDILQSITQHAPHDFEPIKGSDDPTKFSSATIVMPGASRCIVMTKSYSCSWELTSNDALEPSARALAKSIQVCHPSAKYLEEISNGEYWFSIEGDKLSFSVSTDPSGTMVDFLGVAQTVPPVVHLSIEAEN